MIWVTFNFEVYIYEERSQIFAGLRGSEGLRPILQNHL